jgi:Holliday junction resolvasome RuvABC endonuclease subunit
MILGLDISTSITGVTVLNNDGEILHCEAIDTRNKNHFPTLFEKASKVRDYLGDIEYKYDIEHIYIEKSLQTFRSGFSSAKTLSTLASFNGIVSWLCYEIWSTHPEYLSATSARKSCGIKVPRGTKAKKVVIEHLVANEPDFSIEYTKHGNPKPHEFDRADSLVIARAGHYLVKRENS